MGSPSFKCQPDFWRASSRWHICQSQVRTFPRTGATASHHQFGIVTQLRHVKSSRPLLPHKTIGKLLQTTIGRKPVLSGGQCKINAESFFHCTERKRKRQHSPINLYERSQTSRLCPKLSSFPTTHLCSQRKEKSHWPAWGLEFSENQVTGRLFWGEMKIR